MKLEVLKKSGLSQGELASLFDVSRVSMNAYYNGAEPQRNRERIMKIIDVLEGLLEQNKLPLRHNVRVPSERERRRANLEKLKTYVIKHLSN